MPRYDVYGTARIGWSATVEADSEEEARDEAAGLGRDEVDLDWTECDSEVDSVELRGE